MVSPNYESIMVSRSSPASFLAFVRFNIVGRFIGRYMSIVGRFIRRYMSRDCDWRCQLHSLLAPADRATQVLCVYLTSLADLPGERSVDIPRELGAERSKDVVRPVVVNYFMRHRDRVASQRSPLDVMSVERVAEVVDRFSDHTRVNVVHAFALPRPD